MYVWGEEVLVKWRGEDEATWEPVENFYENVYYISYEEERERQQEERQRQQEEMEVTYQIKNSAYMISTILKSTQSTSPIWILSI